jgi:hypothetical protein
MRDYVLTGTARWKIHFSQYVAALIMVIGLMIASGLLSTLTAALFNLGDLNELDTVREDIATDLGGFFRALFAGFMAICVYVMASHSVGSFVRSRGIAIAVIAGYVLIADHILGAIVDESVTFTSAMFGTFLLLVGEDTSEFTGVDPSTQVAVAVAWITLLVAAPLIKLYRKDL